MNIRIAVVGLGWAARTIWLPRLNRHSDLVVTAVVDPNPAARAAADLGATVRVFQQPEEITSDVADLAIVAVPNNAHCAVASGLLRRAVSVFLEKPVCLSSVEAEELASAEKEGGAVLIAGSAARYRADVAALRQLVTSVGRIRHVQLAWVRARGVPGSGWFTRRSLAGGGALVDLGWHLLDVVLPMLGPVVFDEVIGTIGHDFVNQSTSQASWKIDNSNTSGAPYGDVEDTARGFLVTDTGVSISLHASWASHTTHDTTTIEMHGSDGIATLRCTFGFSPNRAGGSRLTLSRDGQVIEVPLADEPIGTEYDRQVDALVEMLADPTSVGQTVDEARRIVDAIERIYMSALSRTANAREVVCAAP